jgi:geranylgeranyl diphosphate synthase type II
MDGSDLLAVDHHRQELVDGVLDRFFSLAKNRASAFGPEYVQLGRVT